MIERLAHYNILARIGAGGMGELYRARDTRHGRTVALRILPSSIRDDETLRAQFLEEAGRAAGLSHPGIAALYETGDDQGRLYAAFEFVPGESLKSLVAAGPLNPRRAVQLAAQIADALAEAHARGFAHGVLGADQIIVTPKGAAKVLDVGLTAWSSRGAAIGSRDEGSARDDAQERQSRADVHALGVLFNEMLGGSTPAGRSQAAPPEILPILARALDLNANGAYESAATFAADLRAADAAMAIRSDASAAKDAVPIHLTSRPASPRAGLMTVLITAAAVAVAVWAARDRLSSTWRHALASSPQPVVAIGPFDQSGSTSYFSSGFAADLAATLGQISGVQVIGRHGAAAGVSARGADLSGTTAAVMLTGTVRPGLDQIQVSIRVAAPATRDAFLEREYTRDLKDIFPLQSEIAADVARAIGVTVTPTAAAERAAARLVDPEAYDAYLRARTAAAEHRLDDAVTLFAAAIQRDDGLAEAHAGLAEALYQEALSDTLTADANRVRARRAAARAYELAPDLPAANVATALAADSIPDALSALTSALRYDPSSADAYRAIADEIQDLDPERARRFRRKALALDTGRDVAAPSDAGPSSPDSCEAGVLAAADLREVRQDRRAASEIRQRFTVAVQRGTASDAGPYAMRCAALSAAALGNPGAAAALLKRIASDQTALRIWTRNARGPTQLVHLRGHDFPWSRVNDQPVFIDARGALEEGYAAARRQVASALDDVTF